MRDDVGIEKLCVVEVPQTIREQLRLADQIVADYFDDCEHGGTGLFVLEPGQMHPAHIDLQPPEWVTRVHVPIETNPHCSASTITQGIIEMKIGWAYVFNTRVEHAVSNAGRTPRVHLVFDVRRKK